MENILVPFGKIIKSSVIGPIKATKNYARTKLSLKKYEKSTGVTPLNKLKKKVYKSDRNFVDMDKEISNQIIKLLTQASANTTDVYFDDKMNPVLSCSYHIEQGLFKKQTSIVCNCISVSAKENATYYYLALCIRHNITTADTESFYTMLQSNI